MLFKDKVKFLIPFNYLFHKQHKQRLNPYGSENSTNGVLGGIRTHDLTIRNHTLYPAELQGHFIKKARNSIDKPLAEWIKFTCLLQLFV